MCSDKRRFLLIKCSLWSRSLDALHMEAFGLVQCSLSAANLKLGDLSILLHSVQSDAAGR